MIEETTVAGKAYKIKSFTLGDRDALLKEFGSLDFKPALEAKVLSICIVDPKFTVEEVMSLDANLADMLYLKVMKSSLPSPDFLQELRSLSSPGLPQEIKKSN